ncbi:MAG: hypothetical protein ACLS23_07875 [Clostridioides difficile]
MRIWTAKFVMSYSVERLHACNVQKDKRRMDTCGLITTVKKDSVDSWTHSINKY